MLCLIYSNSNNLVLLDNNSLFVIEPKKND